MIFSDTSARLAGLISFALFKLVLFHPNSVTEADEPEQVTQPLQKGPVAIDRLGSDEDLQIANEVPHDEPKQRQSSERDDPFSADR
jgi:hypothetical protein